MPAKKVDQQTENALREAIEANAPDLLKPLIDGGVSPDQQFGGNPTTLLEFAAEKNAVEIVRFLIASGAKLDKGPNKPLIHATIFGRTEIVQILLDAGADPNVTHSNPDEGQRGLTALMYAADIPDRNEIITMLLDRGTNPHLATNKGSTALTEAVGRGNLAAADLLIKAGCRPQGPVLFRPIYGGELEMLKLLLAAGADVQALGDKESHFHNRTPLEAAVSCHASTRSVIRSMETRKLKPQEVEHLEGRRKSAQIELEIVAALTNASAAANPGLLPTPLFVASVSGDLESVKLLLAAGADPNKAIGRHVFERTALNAASSGGYTAIAEALIAAGAK